MKHFEKRLPDAELEIMKVIWHNPTPIATSEVKRIIDEQTDNNWTQQTLQTLLNRLIEKEYLAKDKRGREYIYTPLVDEKDYVEYAVSYTHLPENFLPRSWARSLRTAE